MKEMERTTYKVSSKTLEEIEKIAWVDLVLGDITSIAEFHEELKAACRKARKVCRLTVEDCANLHRTFDLPSAWSIACRECGLSDAR